MSGDWRDKGAGELTSGPLEEGGSPATVDEAASSQLNPFLHQNTLETIKSRVLDAL